MAVLFTTTPLVQMVTGSMFVENFVAAMLLGGVFAVWRLDEHASGRAAVLAAALLGTAAAMKLGAMTVVVLALPFSVMAVLRGRGRIGGRAASLAAIVFVVVASLPYAQAWLRTGDPIFPFGGRAFHSWVKEDMRDVRFQEPASWRTPYLLTFETHRYYEGQAGSFGLQYLLLLPLTLLALPWMGTPRGRSAAVIGLGSAAVLIAVQPNARYLYPSLPLLTVAAGAALAAGSRLGARFAWPATVAVATAAAINVWLLPSSGWIHRDFYPSPMFSAKGRLEYEEKMAAARLVVDYLNSKNDGTTVVFLDNSYVAGLRTPSLRNHWHDYDFWIQMEACQRTSDVVRLLESTGAHYFVVERGSRSRSAVLSEVINACGVTEYYVNAIAVVTLRADCSVRVERP